MDRFRERYLDSSRNVPTRFSERLKARQYPKLGEGNCPLEALLPELRLDILHTLPFKSLKSLVRASAVFHSDYRAFRKSLMLEYLIAKLGNVIFDATAAHHSSQEEFRMTRTSESVAAFTESYQRCRTSTPLRSFVKQLTEDEVIGMVCFHRRYMKILIRRFLSMMEMWLVVYLNDLRDSDDSESPDPDWGISYDPKHEAPLSATEKCRIHHALYRLQLCCNLFGHGRWTDCPETRATLELAASQFGTSDITASFLTLYEPWEVEQIGCAYTFAEVEVDSTLEKCKAPDLQAKAEVDGRREELEHLSEVNKILDRHCFRGLMRGTVSRGAELLSVLCGRSIEENWHILPLLRDQIVTTSRAFLDIEYGAMSQANQFPYTEGQKRNTMRMIGREPMLYKGEDPKDPPWAWCVIWNECFSPLFGYWTSSSLILWGHVIWDAQRLMKNGADQLLRDQWQDRWGGEDPRAIYVRITLIEAAEDSEDDGEDDGEDDDDDGDEEEDEGEEKGVE